MNFLPRLHMDISVMEQIAKRETRKAVVSKKKKSPKYPREKLKVMKPTAELMIQAPIIASR